MDIESLEVGKTVYCVFNAPSDMMAWTCECIVKSVTKTGAIVETCRLRKTYNIKANRCFESYDEIIQYLELILRLMRFDQKQEQQAKEGGVA